MSAAEMTCGMVALLGAPNVGKSTLINELVGQKVSIVTRKVQTTRARVRGIVIEGGSQIIFVDTPGIFEPKRRLDRAMVRAAWDEAGDADVVTLLADAERGIDRDTKRIIDGLKQRRIGVVLIINKIDAVRRDSLLGLTESLAETGVFSDIFMISALNGDGVDDLRSFFASQMPFGPWLFPEDQLSDVPQRLLASEITREKLFERVHQELPYATTVETESWEDKRDGSARIDQIIYVERDGQKAIIIGNKGSNIKEIGSQSRAELERIIGIKVHLFLRVKVRPKWADERARYREIGLNFVD